MPPTTATSAARSAARANAARSPAPLEAGGVLDLGDGKTQRVETITPARAERDLENAAANRPLSQAHIDKLASDQKSGAWRVAGQGIAYDQAGRLADGQHRLAACFLTQVPFTTVVTYGLGAQDVAALDQCRARTAADALRISDDLGAQASTIASIFRVITALREKKSVTMSHAAVKSAMAEYAPTVQWILEAGAKTRPLNKVQILAAVTFAHRAAPGLVEAFNEGFLTGAGLAVGSPILALRELALVTLATHKMSERKIALCALDALRAHVEGRPLAALTPDPEAFDFFVARAPERAPAEGR